ncbi:MAG: VOC family protein [Acidimicrobiales bacterium]|jgi:catechol 2,3-dioxygenase-like lactoylglutathione lyase family enzyme
MKPIGVHHVSLNVRNVEEALAFYVDTLGMSRRSDRPDFSFGGAWLDAGRQQVHLIEAEPPRNLGQHFAVQVEGLDATVADLRAAGFTVTNPAQVGSSRQSFISDPSGNVVELHEIETIGSTPK